MKNYNIGLVGYKFMGRAHANAYKRIPMFFGDAPGITTKAVCGRDEQWVSDAARQFGFEGYELSADKLVNRDDIDVIDITAPSNFHEDIAVKAANAGKHVFCEKPLALTLSGARRMLEAAEKNNIHHQIGFNYRFAPAVLLAKKLIDEGKIGKVYHFRGTYLQDWILDPNFPLVWRLDKSVAGSGSLGDLGAHVIDLARFLVGEFDEVVGHSETFVKERPVAARMEGLSAKGSADAPKAPVTVDDATAFIIRFGCGAMGTIEATRFAKGYSNALGFEINGSKGSIKFELERINELLYLGGDTEEEQGFRTIQVTRSMHPYAEHWWPAGHVLGYEHTFVHELYCFLKSIEQGTTATPSFYDGMKCSQILEAVELSAKERRFVKVDSL